MIVFEMSQCLSVSFRAALASTFTILAAVRASSAAFNAFSDDSNADWEASNSFKKVKLLLLSLDMMTKNFELLS